MKKGFTLVELIAVIVVLAIVTMLGFSTYKRVNINIRKQQYKNKTTLIETKAAEYGTKLGLIGKVNVSQLVELGLLSADNDKGDVLNPIDNTRMNCNIVQISREDDNFYGTFTNQEECDYTKLDSYSLGISITKFKIENDINEINIDKLYELDESDELYKLEDLYDLEELESNDWTNSNVLLELNINESEILDYLEKITKEEKGNEEEIKIEENVEKKGLEIKSIKWYIGITQINSNISKRLFLIAPEGNINALYTVVLEIEGSDIKFGARVAVRIDKERPEIIGHEIFKDDEWTNYPKTVRVVGSDNGGSGILGYSRQNKDDYDSLGCSGEESDYSETGNIDTLDVGTYYVCAMDRAGNISEAREIVVKKIDMEEPECYIYCDGNDCHDNWYTEDVSIDFTTSEDGEENVPNNISGIYEKRIYIDGVEKNYGERIRDDYELRYDTSGVEISMVAKDRAGNTCEASTSIKRDATVPTCTKSGENYTWTNESKTINYGCADNLSGCVEENIGSITFSSSAIKEKIPDYGIYDNAGNYTPCNNVEAYVYIDDCTEITEKYKRDYGDCSKKCDKEDGSGPGSKTYVYDAYGTFSGGSYLCAKGVTGTTTCNEQKCCSSVTTSNYCPEWKTIKKCTKTCGGGKKYRTCTETKTSYWDDTVVCSISNYEQDHSCNTQSCPTNNGCPNNNSGDCCVWIDATNEAYDVSDRNKFVDSICCCDVEDSCNGKCVNGQPR